MAQFSPALEKATSKAEVQFPSVYIMQSTPSDTMNSIEDSSDSSSDDEFFDALTGEDLEWLTMEDFQDLSPIEEDWGHQDWVPEDADTHSEQDDTQTDADKTSEENDHPLAGWHSERLAQSDWTDHSFIDKTDHIDTWARHSEYSLARCNWVAFPEDGWPKPTDDSFWGAPDLKLITPEGKVCWLDDPTDYEALPWEKEVAEERNRMLAAIW